MALRHLPLLLVLWYGWQAHAHLPVWQDNVALWSDAALHAQYKPRVTVNYGLVLLARGDTAKGFAQLKRAQQLASLPHIPAYDARITRETVAANIVAFVEARRR